MALPPGGYAQTEPYVRSPRSDDEIMAWLASPGGPLRAGTEITPQMIAQYRDSGQADAGMDALALRRQAEDAAYRAAQTGSMGMLVDGPMSSGVADPAAAFKQFVGSGYSGSDALRDGWLVGTGVQGWASPNTGGPVNPQQTLAAMASMYRPSAPAPAPQPPPQAPAPQTSPPSSPTPPQSSATPPMNTVPAPVPQPTMNSATPGAPSPPSAQQPSTGAPPTPATPRGMGRGFGQAPRWNGGGQGFGGFGGRFGHGQQQPGQAMRNLYGGR